MAGPLLGLHHVTATVDQPQADLNFCLDALGLRLVKKTVNFDNHDVYHFYDGTERGARGTIWTTFPYHQRGVRPGAKGAGQGVATAFSVAAASLDSWRARLQARGVAMRGEEQRFGETVLRFADPSGLWFELAGTTSDARPPWTGNGVGADAAIRGLHSVTMLVRSLPPSLTLLTGVLGYAVVEQTEHRTRVAVGGNGAGHVLDLVVDPEAPRAINGLGTVHHVAMAIGTDEEQLALREELVERGVGVTEVRDRCYFHSIYFREPGGVLFEVATVQPGFAVDEELASLGRDLKLPPWEEPHRVSIEANLARAPLGAGPVAVIMVHGRNAGPANILDLVPRLARPQPVLIWHRQRPAAPGIPTVFSPTSRATSRGGRRR